MQFVAGGGRLKTIWKRQMFAGYERRRRTGPRECRSILSSVQPVTTAEKQESCAIAQMTARCALYECPESFWMYIENLKCVALAIPEIIAIGVLSGVVNPNLGEEEVVGGRGWYHLKERLWVPIGFHSNFSSILTRSRYCCYCAPARHFFPPHLQSPQNFSMFTWE